MAGAMKYKGNTPVKARDQVELITADGEVYDVVRVADALATQFTVQKKGRTRFFFYEDKGLTWRPLPK